MFVLTLDQHDSTHSGDRVPELLSQLPGGAGVTAAFERTVGDEIQGVMDSPHVVLDVVRIAIRNKNWQIGIGAGPVDLPLPEHSREASGPAFLYARVAVELAKKQTLTVPIAVVGQNSKAASEAESVLRILGSILQRRTASGWAAIDAMEGAAGAAGAVQAAGNAISQKDAARLLGVSPPAVSQRLRTALYAEELAVIPVLARLLGEAQA